ncbi:MAG: T9SS type A sorting domain-containing protein, partial [Ignavibacteriaceae bacterium]
VTLGDNNYPLGADSTIDQNIGQYYHDYIYPYKGTYGTGSNVNRFFPALGNHDWYTDSAKPYFNYFELPGNERYYDIIRGEVHLFILDSDPNEPHGYTDTSIQARWLKDELALSWSKWNIVTVHHAPYSSGPHGSTLYAQWPYKLWGADLVLSGHDHDYERLVVDSLTYIVCGTGGHSLYTFIDTINGSVFQYNSNYGALLIEANENKLTTKFYNVNGELIDSANIEDRVGHNYVDDYLLNQNYPNPFNSFTRITYEIPVEANVSIVLYDILGRKVETLIDEYKTIGKYEVEFTADNIASGIYFYTLRSGNFTQTRKMILLK